MSLRLPVAAEKKITEKAFLALMPSAKLKLALEDLMTVEKDKEHFSVDMGDWIHFYPKDGSPFKNICSVCFAGSVLVQRFGHIDFGRKFPNPLYDVANGLDAIRSDRPWDGLPQLMPLKKDLPVDWYNLPFPTIVPYETNKAKFKNSIRSLISVLEKHGL